VLLNSGNEVFARIYAEAANLRYIALYLYRYMLTKQHRFLLSCRRISFLPIECFNGTSCTQGTSAKYPFPQACVELGPSFSHRGFNNIAIIAEGNCSDYNTSKRKIPMSLTQRRLSTQLGKHSERRAKRYIQTLLPQLHLFSLTNL
jgi:hypothetical protein